MGRSSWWERVGVGLSPRWETALPFLVQKIRTVGDALDRTWVTEECDKRVDGGWRIENLCHCNLPVLPTHGHRRVGGLKRFFSYQVFVLPQFVVVQLTKLLSRNMNA